MESPESPFEKGTYKQWNVDVCEKEQFGKDDFFEKLRDHFFSPKIRLLGNKNLCFHGWKKSYNSKRFEVSY